MSPLSSSFSTAPQKAIWMTPATLGKPLQPGVPCSTSGCPLETAGSGLRWRGSSAYRDPDRSNKFCSDRLSVSCER